MPRPLDDGMVEFFDNIPDLRPWLGAAFKERLVSDFYVKDVVIRDSDIALHGKYVFYYTILYSLPVNECCARYIGFNPPADRLFWRGDIVIVRDEGELGSGHKYADAPARLARTIESSIRSAYERSALEDMVEFNENSSAQHSMRHPWDHALETGAIERSQSGQPMSDEDGRLIDSILLIYNN